MVRCSMKALDSGLRLRCTCDRCGCHRDKVLRWPSVVTVLSGPDFDDLVLFGGLSDAIEGFVSSFECCTSLDVSHSDVTCRPYSDVPDIPVWDRGDGASCL